MTIRRKRALAALALACALLGGCAPRFGAAAEEGNTPPEAPAEPPAAAEKTAADAYGEAAETLLAGMSREEKVWQMLAVFPQDVTGAYSCADAALWREGLAARPAGALVFDGDNMESEAALRAMLAAAAGAGKCAPLLCVDEEGGAVARLAYNLGVTTRFRPMFDYRRFGGETAFSNARTIALEIADFGFNTDLAPVADVRSNPENTVIGRRAYSDDPAEAAALVAEAVRGFHAGGVLCTLKHFPGHGDTAEDSHAGAAVCAKTRAELDACELQPFVSGIEAGADMVMVGHITLPEIDPERPATLSPAIVTGLLRGELGFSGVVVTDALRMGALAAYADDPGRAAVLAVEAGCDLLLAPQDPDAAARALLEQLDDARIDESVRRILRMKLARGVLPLPEAAP